MITSRFMLALGACITSCALSTTMRAAPQASDPQGGSYAAIDKLPDWSGVWVIPFDSFRADNERENQPGSPTAPDLTREAIAKRAAAREQLLRRASQDASGAASRATSCGPPRVMPAVMRYAFGIELLFTPGRVTMLLELGPTVRRIYTDGRMHSSDPDPTRAGESIGHWERDTLVVDTVGIIAITPMLNGFYTSGHTHITERIRRIDRTHLQIDTVVDDPIVLLTPWRYRRIYERSEAGSFELNCENNRDGDDAEPDLTPPK